MSTMTRTTAYAVLSRAVAAQRNGSAPEQVARLDAALAVAGEVLLAAEDAEAMPVEFARALEMENARLRAGCSAIAAALGNGSAAAPCASVEFLTAGLAKEVRLYCADLRRQIVSLTPDAGQAQ